MSFQKEHNYALNLVDDLWQNCLNTHILYENKNSLVVIFYLWIHKVAL